MKHTHEAQTEEWQRCYVPFDWEAFDAERRRRPALLSPTEVAAYEEIDRTRKAFPRFDAWLVAHPPALVWAVDRDESYADLELGRASGLYVTPARVIFIRTGKAANIRRALVHEASHHLHYTLRKSVGTGIRMTYDAVHADNTLSARARRNERELFAYAAETFLLSPHELAAWPAVAEMVHGVFREAGIE